MHHNWLSGLINLFDPDYSPMAIFFWQRQALLQKVPQKPADSLFLVKVIHK
jgi:hypothetical protein